MKKVLKWPRKLEPQDMWNVHLWLRKEWTMCLMKLLEQLWFLQNQKRRGVAWFCKSWTGCLFNSSKFFSLFMSTNINWFIMWMCKGYVAKLPLPNCYLEKWPHISSQKLQHPEVWVSILWNTFTFILWVKLFWKFDYYFICSYYFLPWKIT